MTLDFGVRECYQCYHNAFYEYITVINFTNEPESILSLDASCRMDLYCLVKQGTNFSTFEINFKFSDIKEETIIQNLDIEIVSIYNKDSIIF